MSITCICCHDWEFENEDFEEWETCPNCEFPRRFTGWIEQLQSEIASLKEENQRLHKRLNSAFTNFQDSQ